MRDQKQIIYHKNVGIKVDHIAIKSMYMYIYNTEEFSDKINFLAQQ
jgi:hypothetical protein